MGKRQASDNGAVRVLCLGALVLCTILQVTEAQATLPNCSYPAVFSFGDSLSDVGNSIAAFPEQFGHAELDPNGIIFPMHAADRFSDGKLLVDFLGTWFIEKSLIEI